LFPIFIIIQLEKEFHHVIAYRFVIDRVLIFFAAPLLFYFFWRLFFKQPPKAALMALGCLLIFYFSGDLKTWLSARFPNSFIQSYVFLFLIFSFFLLLLFAWLKLRERRFTHSFLFINSLLLVFILADAAILLMKGNKGRYSIISDIELKNTACNSCSRPDIYYIIFDAYISSERLRTEFNYSNKYIDDWLTNKGFRVIPQSKSNYNFTAYSIGSIFNLNYIQNADTIGIISDREYLQALKLVYCNSLIPYLQKEGYQIFNYSIFDIASHPAFIQNIDFWRVRELFDQYNLLYKFYHDIEYQLPRSVKNFLKNKYFVNSLENRVRTDSAILNQLLHTVSAKENGPKFVYAHFLRPHLPFFADSLGHSLANRPITLKDAYNHQIAWSNRVIKEIADSIFVHSQRPFVIIIQGDHGCFPKPQNPRDFFPNFNAVYFSNKDYSLITDSTHSVNTFRIVLNTFFNKSYDLLRYQSYPFNSERTNSQKISPVSYPKN